MALSDVMKKRETTNEEEAKKKESSGIKNLLDDVRVVIGIIAVACIALIALIVYTNGNSATTLKRIETIKGKIINNQQEIAQLEALKSRDAEVRKQQEYYESLISNEGLDREKIMIQIEDEVEEHNCNLTDISFDDVTSSGSVNQISVKVNISGNFNDILSYCDSVIGSKEIRRIDSFKMTDSSGSDNLKYAEITIVLFSK